MRALVLLLVGVVLALTYRVRVLQFVTRDLAQAHKYFAEQFDVHRREQSIHLPHW